MRGFHGDLRPQHQHSSPQRRIIHPVPGIIEFKSKTMIILSPICHALKAKLHLVAARYLCQIKPLLVANSLPSKSCNESLKSTMDRSLQIRPALA